MKCLVKRHKYYASMPDGLARRARHPPNFAPTISSTLSWPLQTHARCLPAASAVPRGTLKFPKHAAAGQLRPCGSPQAQCARTARPNRQAACSQHNRHGGGTSEAAGSSFHAAGTAADSSARPGNHKRARQGPVGDGAVAQRQPCSRPPCSHGLDRWRQPMQRLAGGHMQRRGLCDRHVSVFAWCCQGGAAGMQGVSPPRGLNNHKQSRQLSWGVGAATPAASLAAACTACLNLHCCVLLLRCCHAAVT